MFGLKYNRKAIDILNSICLLEQIVLYYKEQTKYVQKQNSK